MKKIVLVFIFIFTLMLSGCCFSHEIVIDNKIEPTCTTEGLTEGSHCSVCGKVIIEQQVIPMKEHTEVIDEGYESTCTSEGLTEGSHCSVCGKVIIEQQVIPIKEHTEVIDEGYEATCTSEGLTEGSHCSVCDKVIIEQDLIIKLEHSYTNGKCVICQKINFADISLYSSYEAEEFFEKQSNGHNMQRLYNEMEQELSEFHNDINQNAVYKCKNPELGELYTVGTFNYKKYNLNLDEAKTVYTLFRKDHQFFIG